MSTVIWKNEARTEFVAEPDWKASNGVRLHLLITKDVDGIYSAVVLNLPGAGSCGDTEEEAICNAMDATRGVLEVYEGNDEEIPWKDTASMAIPVGAKQKWVILDA